MSPVHLPFADVEIPRKVFEPFRGNGRHILKQLELEPDISPRRPSNAGDTTYTCRLAVLLLMRKQRRKGREFLNGLVAEYPVPNLEGLGGMLPKAIPCH